MPLSRFGVLVAQLESIVASAAQQPPEPLLCFDLLSDLISAIDEEPKVHSIYFAAFHFEFVIIHLVVFRIYFIGFELPTFMSIREDIEFCDIMWISIHLTSEMELLCAFSFIVTCFCFFHYPFGLATG